MPGFEETLKYKVELDTQGLQAQLSSVRDVVGRGLQGAAGGVAAGVSIAQGAVNQVTGDLALGGSLMMGVAQRAGMSLAPVGMSSTFLANQPGMPRGFFGEVTTAFGVQAPPVGVMGQQAQFVARERLRDRVQSGLGEVGGFAAGMAGWQVGAAVGTIFGPAGTVIGGIGGAILGDVAFRPVIQNMQERQAFRAQTMDTFGFNFLSHQQRMNLSESLSAQSARSLFSSEEFQHMMPGAMQAGFFRGIMRGQGADQAIAARMAEAENFTVRGMYALGVTGTQGMQQTLEMAGQLRRMGVNLATAEGRGQAERHFQLSNVLAQQIRVTTGEVVSPADLMQVSTFVGQQAQTMGLNPLRAMDAFRQQTMVLNEAMLRGQIGAEDISLLGGSPVEAAQRLTFSMAGVARHPVMRALSMAAAQVGPGGEVAIDPTQVSQMMGANGFEMAQQRLLDMSSGREGPNRLFALMANQNQLQSQMMQHQGEALMGISDEILRQGGLDVNNTNRMLVMQRVYGVGEAESRALVQSAGLTEVAREKATDAARELSVDVSEAIRTKQESIAQQASTFFADIKSSLGGWFDRLTDSITSRVVPPLEGAQDKLGRIQELLGDRTRMSSHSPISVGPIDFTGSKDIYTPPAATFGIGHQASPPDPSTSHIFGAAERSLALIPRPMQTRVVEAQAATRQRTTAFGGRQSVGA